MQDKNNGWKQPEEKFPETELEDSFSGFFSREEEVSVPKGKRRRHKSAGPDILAVSDNEQDDGFIIKEVVAAQSTIIHFCRRIIIQNEISLGESACSLGSDCLPCNCIFTVTDFKFPGKEDYLPHSCKEAENSGKEGAEGHSLGLYTFMHVPFPGIDLCIDHDGSS